MVAAMDKEGFGPCTNITECAAVCPKEIDISVIARMNRDRIGAIFLVARRSLQTDAG
jgi:succinate dehydrogenase / fumarate reductase iron-sulfur subunit